LIYHPIGLPPTAIPIPFCLAIQTGWMAHCLEYLPDGAMIEPGAVYLTEPATP
jgi:citrate synthase